MVLQHRNRVHRIAGNGIIRDVRRTLRLLPENPANDELERPQTHRGVPSADAAVGVTLVERDSSDAQTDRVAEQALAEIRGRHTSAVGQPISDLLRQA